jgi:DNA primase
VRQYLAERGITDDDVQRYRLGVALGQSANDRLFARYGAELVASGVVRQNDDSRRDFLAGRLIFPIRDVAGRTVALAGRIFPWTGPRPDGSKRPKYLNTSVSPIYKKESLLWGLDLARKAATERDELVIAEGYMDVIALRRAGIPNAVCASGTAVGAHHLSIAGRYAKRVVVCLDGDEAGQLAAEAMLNRVGKPAGVQRLLLAVLPAGKDPDELIADDAQAMRKVIDDALSATLFRLRRLLGSLDLTTEAGRAAALAKGVELLAASDDLFARDHLTELADRCGVAPYELRSSFDKLRRRGAGRQRQPSEQPTLRPVDRTVTVAGQALLAYAQYRERVDHLVDRELFSDQSLEAKLFAALASSPSRQGVLDQLGDDGEAVSFASALFATELDEDFDPVRAIVDLARARLADAATRFGSWGMDGIRYAQQAVRTRNALECWQSDADELHRLVEGAGELLVYLAIDAPAPPPIAETACSA